MREIGSTFTKYRKFSDAEIWLEKSKNLNPRNVKTMFDIAKNYEKGGIFILKLKVEKSVIGNGGRAMTWYTRVIENSSNSLSLIKNDGATHPDFLTATMHTLQCTSQLRIAKILQQQNRHHEAISGNVFHSHGLKNIF